MAQLAKCQPVLGIVYKEISDHTTMRTVTGDAAHLPAGPFFCRIKLAGQRVRHPRRRPNNMNLAANVPMTRQTEVINGF